MKELLKHVWIKCMMLISCENRREGKSCYLSEKGSIFIDNFVDVERLEEYED